MSKKMRVAEEWVDGGIPWPPTRDTMLRWVAEIQEDAVSCYATTAAIEAVEEAVQQVEQAFAMKATDDDLEAKLKTLRRIVTEELSPMKV